MYIKSLYIESFAALENKSLELSRGLNIIEGNNESGKSTICMFIKFMLYGLSGRTNEGEMSERAKYVSWTTKRAAGKMLICSEEGEFLIERSLNASDDSEGQLQYRETLEVTDKQSGERVLKGQVPGEAILGLPENLFVNTVFVRQISGSRIDGNGMAQAIENILLSGDENVNVKKAMDRLEKARKSLWHKRGGGGKIQLALQEKARLGAKLDEARTKNAGMISYENESARLSALIEKRTAERDESAAVYEAYQKLRLADRLEKARELEAQIAALSKREEELLAYGNISAHIGRINSFSARLSGVDSRLKTLRRSMKELPSGDDSMGEEKIASASADKTRADSLASKKKTRLISSLALLLAGGALGAIGLLLTLERTVQLVLLAAGGALLAAFAVLFVMFIGASRAGSAVLEKWGAENVGELSHIIDKKIQKAREYEIIREDIARKTEEESQLEKERGATIGALKESAAVFASTDTPDTDLLVSLALENAQALLKEKEEIIAKMSLAKGELRAFGDVLADDGGRKVEEDAIEVLKTAEGQRAERLTDAEAQVLAQRKNFAEKALPALLTQKGEADAALAHLRATAQDSATIASLLDCADRDIEKMQLRLEGIEAAQEALLLAGEELRSSLMPRVCERACELLFDFTKGKYSELKLGRDFDIDILLDGKMRDISYMSKGTADAIYISLRLAMTMEMFSDDAPPMIYDESFAGIDESRLERIIGLIDTSCDKLQSLVFTCRSLEGAVARNTEVIRI